MQNQTSLSRNSRVNGVQHKRTFAISPAILLVLTLFATPTVQAQTFSVIHNFTGGLDGEDPSSGVTVGPSGVLYGTTPGGENNTGTVFKLSRANSSWVFTPLYEFPEGSDAGYPFGGVVIGPNGALYGTTDGGDLNPGTVFELRPPPTFCRSVLCYWNETVLHAFTGQPTDGANPEYVNLAFDQAGNIYGTTVGGGMSNGGTTFELTPSGGGYTESIYSFRDGYPSYGVVLDIAGNVYGTTAGTVYQLMPSSGGWVENVLVHFDGTNGSDPISGLLIDASGNLYGTTFGGGQNNGDGVVYKLAPSGGGFTYSALYTFSSYCESYGGVAMDAAGDFFGGCYVGGAHGNGWIYELTNCSQACTVVDLHDFSGSDGSGPYGAPALDANGNLYGTTLSGGTGNCDSGAGCGVVWEIAGVAGRHPVNRFGARRRR